MTGATVASTPMVIIGELFFAATDAVHGSQIWENDGINAGSLRLTTANALNGGLNPKSLTGVGNTLYFAASTPAAGRQVWKSDGTAAGTVLVTHNRCPR